MQRKPILEGEPTREDQYSFQLSLPEGHGGQGVSVQVGLGYLVPVKGCHKLFQRIGHEQQGTEIHQSTGS